MCVWGGGGANRSGGASVIGWVLVNESVSE